MMDNKPAAHDGTSNVPTTSLAGDDTGSVGPVNTGPQSLPPTSGAAMGPLGGLVLALVAAAMAYGLIETTHPVFHVPEKFHIGMNAPTDAILANRRATDQVLRYHAMLYVGSLGLILGLLLGVREGMLRRAWLTPVVAGMLGALGGDLGGFLGCLVYEYVRFQVGQATLMHTIIAQWLVGAPLGLGVGLGLGLATRTMSGTLKAALGGVAAATLAAVLFPVLVSIVMPAASTEALLPEERGSRGLWLGLLAGLIGLVIPLSGRRR
jgi:hypothetical protein